LYLLQRGDDRVLKPAPGDEAAGKNPCRLNPLSANDGWFYLMMNSTLLFLERPSGVLLFAMGFLLP